MHGCQYLQLSGHKWVVSRNGDYQWKFNNIISKNGYHWLKFNNIIISRWITQSMNNQGILRLYFDLNYIMVLIDKVHFIKCNVRCCDTLGTLLPHTLYMTISTLHSRPIGVWCGFWKWVELLSTCFMTITLEGMKLLNMRRWCSRTTTIPLFECGHEMQVLLPLSQLIKHRNTMQC
jgi:hypothetical protein